MRKILVTGGAGFVGRHLVKRFLDAGDVVHCVVDLTLGTGGLDPKRWPLFNPCDYRNFDFFHEDCRAYFKRVRDDDFDYAFHLAAVVGGRPMIESNPLAVADDLSIHSGYWQWAASTKPKKTICFSSSAAYPIKLQGENGYVFLREDMIDFSRDLGVPDYTYG